MRTHRNPDAAVAPALRSLTKVAARIAFSVHTYTSISVWKIASSPVFRVAMPINQAEPFERRTEIVGNFRPLQRTKEPLGGGVTNT